MAEFDPMRMSLDEQVAYLLEDTYFADEGGLGGAGLRAGQDASTESRATSLRSQMAAELRAKLELSAKLKAKGDPNWPLRVYYGADPTRTSLHIGHMIPVSHLRRFQQLGHQAVFLIGDYTAMIGDPSGQSAERAQLSHDDVLEMSRFYTDQAHRLLHADTTEVEYGGGSVTELGAEVRYNGEWLAGLGFAELAELMAQFPVKQILAREDFRGRLDEGESLRAHELLYSVMQGYDAFALNCDVQVGGYDQHFNLLAGRELQRHFEKKYAGGEHPLFAAQPATGRRVKGPHVMLTYPLLMGTDGRKMSKSWGNTIDVLDEPADMYGKVMRISDEMIGHYVDVAVDARPEEKSQWKARAAGEPMEVKKWIARRITALYNGEDAASKAEEHFRRTVQERQVDEADVVELRVPDGWRGEHLGVGNKKQAVAEHEAAQPSLAVQDEQSGERVAQPSVAVWDSELLRTQFPSTVDDFKSYTRNLPHWRLSGSVYFLTWRLHGSHQELPFKARRIINDALKHFDRERYHLVAFVVMNDHIHVVVKPIAGNELAKLTHSWKSFTANRIQREAGLEGAIWQDESWDRIVRDEDELFEKIYYILNNPAKRWPGIQGYEWVYLNLPAASESYLISEDSNSASLAGSSYTATEGCATPPQTEVPERQLQQQLQPKLVDLLLTLALVPSKSEARRLIEQGGVKLDGAAVCDQFAPYIHLAPTLLQVGKRKVVRLV